MAVLGLLVILAAADWTLPDMPETAEWSRLPRFFSSDPAWDAFINDYYARHLSADERGVYFPTSVAPGLPDQLWVTEWDAWFLSWVDRAALGRRRNQGNALDMPRFVLANVPVDRHGYAYGARLWPEPNDSLGGWRPLYGWPWPKYNWNRTVTQPTGWEFNDPADGQRERWRAEGVALQPGYVDHRLAGTIESAGAWLQSPPFEVDAFHASVVELDLEFNGLAGRDPLALLDGLRLEWTTAAEPEFAPERSVGIAFASLPPRDFADAYRDLVNVGSARYPLYFPMCLHPGWGRGGQRITGLRLRLPDAPGLTVAVNYLRATYDVRLSTSNTTLIRASADFFLWSGDEPFLRWQLPRLRRAMLFCLEHLRGREGLLDLAWFVGHDGLGGPDVGHGQIGSYWDLLPAGRFDLESSGNFVAALRAMAALEEAAAARGIAAPEVTVVGPDDRTVYVYREAPASLRALADRAQAACEAVFWQPEAGRFARNIDATGHAHDYGFVHANLQALALGVGTAAQRDAILSWLDGRVVPGDTSTGADIYHWRFAPRTSTRANESWYFWPWVEGRREKLPIHAFGNQMQDGGAIPLTSLLELVARCATGEQAQVDRAFERTRQIAAWYADVQAAGGAGTEFYRAYYAGHTERGLQQGGGPPGGLGLDREFLSDSALGTTFPLHAFLGARVDEDRVLKLRPALPSALDRLGVANVAFGGCLITIAADRTGVDVEVTAGEPAGLEVEVDFGGEKVRVPLRSGRIERPRPTRRAGRRRR